MNSHKHARLTAKGRALLVSRVLDEGWTMSAASEAAGVSKRTGFKWVARFKAEGQAGLFTFRGEPIGQVNTKAWTAALERAGIEDFRWHDLRHTFATWHRQAGTPTHELQRLGGWKTGAMVERYAHVAPEALQGAAARLDAVIGYAGATPNEQGVSPN